MLGALSGYTLRGHIFPLPFGNVASGNMQVNIRAGDAINDMAAELLFNPRANLVTKNNGYIAHVARCYF
ncbi:MULTISPECIES: hypothetical protein [Marinomonas]|uniref:Uncharacterized protein n=1 Tax=Marinomonas rhodophyticola TaxID=2992803 RepID=A0ABT3KBB0_9GAMM|nr:hypothetical protein [Marinomonas sp. KJ51-3]MCW4627815.1 hypothetical protein [Marinomonas sp. KJ51-3]